ncbi:uncharacterized protein LOC114557932 isoform X3 [Perca flavescens]|uniref:uncharacterized protein LOC114557932 isoform X3 n=1 Tax=Perca flavescens TaxID=8167 RepID=UPI00106E6B8F|nr:uncharacterized protein LOC114557932 isoform X3 [Perca flavescens]
MPESLCTRAHGENGLLSSTWRYQSASSSCDAPAARCWCVDCNEALCDVCVSAHRRVTVTRSHRILNQPQEGGVSTCPTKFCRLHPSEPLKLFCFTCNMLTCRDCQLTAHMNHRYQFVSEALDSLKKELEDCVRPISKQRDAAWKSLQDMETRLRDIADSESNLSSELQRSYLFLTQQIKTRMEDILKNVKTVCETETQLIQTKMNKLKQLLKDQDSVAKFTENAQNSNDVSTLTAYNVQIKSHVKAFHNLNLSPPQRMSQLWVSTDKVSLEAILNFGRLNVNWVPFSVSNTSNQNAPSSSSSSPTPSSPSLTSPSSSSPCPPPLGGPSPQTRTLVSPPATCSSTTSTSYPSQTFLSTSSSPSLVPPPPDHLAPSQKTISDQFVTPPPRTANTDSPVPPNCPATSWKSSSNQQSLPPTASNHSKALMPASTTQTGQHPKKRRQTVSDSENSQRPRFAVLELVQQPLVAQQPATAAVLLSNTQSAYQVSCFALLAAALPLRQIAPGNTGPEPQKSLMGTIVPVSTPGQLTPVPASCPIPPAPTTGNQISVVPSPAAVPRQTQEKEQHQRLKEVNSSSTSHAASRSCEQRLSPDIDPRPSSPKQQQQQNNPVVRAMADSACDGGVQQFAPRRQEPAENEPTSTMSEELAPAGEPSAADESDRDAEEREVSDRDTEVSDRDAEVVTDRDADVVMDRDAEVIMDRDAEIVLDRDAEVVMDRDAEVVSDRDAEVVTDRDAEVVTDRDAEMVSDRDAGMVSDRDAEMVSDRDAEMASDKDAEMASDRDAEMASDRDAEMASDRDAEVVSDRDAEVVSDRDAEVVSDRDAEVVSDRDAEIVSDRDAKAVLDRDAEVITDRDAEIVSDRDAETVSDRDAEVITDRDAEIITDRNAEIVSDRDAEIVSDRDAEIVSDRDAEMVSDRDAEMVSDRDAEMVSDRDAEAVTDRDAEAVTDRDAEAVTDRDAEVVSDKDAEVVSDRDAEAVSDGDAEAVSDGDAEAVSDRDAEVVSDRDAEVVSDRDAEVVSDRDAEVVSDRDAEVVSDRDAEAVSDRDAEAVLDRDAEVVSDRDAEAVLDGDAEIGSDRDAKVTDRDADSSDKDTVVSNRDNVVSDGDTVVSDGDTVVSDRDADELELSLEVTESEAEELAAEVSETDAGVLDRDAEVLDRGTVVSDRDTVVSDRDAEVSDRDTVVSDRDTVVSDRDTVVSDRDTVVSDRDAEESDRDTVVSDRDTVESDRDAEELELSLEVTESEAEASETDTGVSNRGAEPEISDGDAGVSDRDAEKPEPVVSDGEAGILDGDNGMSDCSSSQWQPRVSLFRLPVLSQRHKRPLPSFRLIAGEADDEIYLEEMSQETTSLSDDVTDDSADDIGTLSPPGSPLAVQMVACSACRLANASIICMSCGRGFHQDCHIPPVRPDIMSDWICSLCQDLSDPSDPFLSHRPQRPASLGLSLLNQRRCEKLLLLLKVKASSRLSEAHLDWMKDRLTRGSPAYQTAADFLSDVRRLFRDAAPGDFFLNNLQKRMKSLSAAFMAEEKSTAGANVAADAPESERSKVTAREEPEVMSYEARLKETRKRLREALMDGSHSKRRKTEPPPEDSGK